MTRRSRRRFLTGVATIGTASVPGIATGSTQNRQRQRAEPPVTQNTESTLEYFEETIEEYTERLARAYVNPEGQARLTYITDSTAVSAIRDQIRQLADAYVRVVETGGTLPRLYCLAQYGELGQRFSHRAEFRLEYRWARDYSLDNITLRQYRQYIYDTLELY